ncbi:MAG: hypothetical protein ABGX83_00595 [Nitrospira sp.]|nr:hypothetical protein [Candidatus Manganitrophaceae bacterium]HIL35757.1 hypothetical protein [Candidatus Manganitrophaceae bacterium]
MKSKKIRQFFGFFSASLILLAGLSLSGVLAQTARVPAEEALHGDALFQEIEQQNASVPLLQVSNMTQQEVMGARLNWATAEMGKAVFAAVRGEVTAPIAENAVHVIRSQAGFGHLDDFRLALTLLSEERGQSMTHLVPGPVTPMPARANNYTSAGWGGFAEFGFFSLVAFAYVMWLSSWVAIDLERHGVREEEKPYEYPMAA